MRSKKYPLIIVKNLPPPIEVNRSLRYSLPLFCLSLKPKNSTKKEKNIPNTVSPIKYLHTVGCDENNYPLFSDTGPVVHTKAQNVFKSKNTAKTTRRFTTKVVIVPNDLSVAQGQTYRHQINPLFIFVVLSLIMHADSKTHLCNGEKCNCDPSLKIN